MTCLRPYASYMWWSPWISLILLTAACTSSDWPCNELVVPIPKFDDWLATSHLTCMVLLLCHHLDPSACLSSSIWVYLYVPNIVVCTYISSLPSFVDSPYLFYSSALALKVVHAMLFPPPCLVITNAWSLTEEREYNNHSTKSTEHHWDLWLYKGIGCSKRWLFAQDMCPVNSHDFLARRALLFKQGMH